MLDFINKFVIVKNIKGRIAQLGNGLGNRKIFARFLSDRFDSDVLHQLFKKLELKEFPTKYIDYDVIEELNILNVSREAVFGLRTPIIFSYIPFHRVVLIRTTINDCANTTSIDNHIAKQFITQALYSIFKMKMRVISCDATWLNGADRYHSGKEYTTSILVNIFEYRKLYKSYCKLKLSR